MAVEIQGPAFTDDVSQSVGSYNSFTVYVVTAPGAGTLEVDISPDGTHWFKVANVPASNYLTVTDAAAYARVHGGSGTAGSYVIRGIYSHEGG